MRAAGRLAFDLLEELERFIEPGVTTLAIDQLVDFYTTEAGAISAPLNYRGFPAHCCTSVNEVVCHGIPSDRELVEGDIINVDVTPKLKGFHGDSSRTFAVGSISPEAQKLIDVTKQCLQKGIAALYPNCPVSVVGEAIQPFAEEHGFSVVRQYTGHGTGKVFHKDPPIPHMVIRTDGTMPLLKPGMTFTIEPMINMGGWETVLQPDKWTAVTKDQSLSAQYEHTLLMTGAGVEILTEPEGCVAGELTLPCAGPEQKRNRKKKKNRNRNR